MSELLVQHLTSVLTRKGMVAYIWDEASDRFQWTGDVKTLLGCAEEKDWPRDSRAFNLLVNPQDLPQRLAGLNDARNGKPAMLVYKLRRPDGSQAEVMENVFFEKHGDKQVLTGTLELKEWQGERRANGRMPPPPGMVHSGRRALQERIERWAELNWENKKTSGYFLAAGIDRLSFLNESYGARYVDELIECSFQRLQDIIGEAGEVGRINGDVFGIFFERGPHSEMAAVAKHLLDNFYQSPLVTSQGHMTIGVSIGGTMVAQKDCRDPASVLTRAEMALTVAKERGRGCFVSYNEASEQAVTNRVLLESGDDFLRALKLGRVRLAFQPVVDFGAQRVAFHECLIRMIDEDGKVRSAGEFVPAIEHMGLSRVVDQFALAKAIHELNQFPDLSLSVNISYMTLISKEWLRGLVAVLRDRPGLARRLIIEITESMVIKDIPYTMRVIRTLKELGCRVALDDFGAGFTAFSQLKDINLDIVKIDKSFTCNMKDKRNHLFVKVLQMLADGVGVETVGEGVETMEDARVLAEEGVSHIQGYAFGFPCVERVWLPKGHAFRGMEEENRAGNPASAEAEMFTRMLSGGSLN